MQCITIEGGRKLFGKVAIAPAKNACLPIIASSIAINGTVFLKGAPKITDVAVMAEIIADLGGKFSLGKDGLFLSTEGVKSFIGRDCIYGKVRASLFTAGALLSRFKKAYIPYPGGCNIGDRPIDIHIDGLKALGVKAECFEDGVFFDGSNMHAGNVKLRYPSVGATVNILCAALCLDGETIIDGVACEPEIADLCRFLSLSGYRIRAVGRRIYVNGTAEIVKTNIEYKPVSDRIEAGTFMLACVACGGEVEMEYDCINNIKAVMDIINEIGMRTYFNNGSVIVKSDRRPNEFNIMADYFPAFPTDLQPQLSAVACVANGRSIIADNVFPGRFCYSGMLNKFGAKTNILKGKIVIDGVENLNAAEVEATDLRGGAALCIAAMASSGKSAIKRSDVILRGYENFCEKINMLGGCANEI